VNSKLSSSLRNGEETGKKFEIAKKRLAIRATKTWLICFPLPQQLDGWILSVEEFL